MILDSEAKEHAAERSGQDQLYASQTSVRWISGKERGYSHTVQQTVHTTTRHYDTHTARCVPHLVSATVEREPACCRPGSEEECQCARAGGSGDLPLVGVESDRSAGRGCRGLGDRVARGLRARAGRVPGRGQGRGPLRCTRRGRGEHVGGRGRVADGLDARRRGVGQRR